MQRSLISLIVLALVGCGGSQATTTAPPPVGPTNVVLAGATVTTAGAADNVDVSLENTGGAGDFYLDFYGFLNDGSVHGCKLEPGQTSCPPVQGVHLVYSQSVNVLAGYSQQLEYPVTAGVVLSVRVMSRSTNSAVYTQTSCKTVRAAGLCPP